MKPKETLEFARLYLKHGLSVIPIQPKDKRPVVAWERFQKDKANDEDLVKWFSAGKNNIAIICGSISGIVVLDIDGEEGLKSIKDKVLPITPCVRTAKGFHYFFKHPGGLIRNTARRLPGIDTRADGGYVVSAPSVHPDGHVYEWVEGLGIWETPLAPIPEWVTSSILEFSTSEPAGKGSDKKGEEAGHEWVHTLLEGVEKGERNVACARLAGYYLHIGRKEKEVITLLTGWNARNKPPLPADEIERTVNSISKRAGHDSASNWAGSTLIQVERRLSKPPVYRLHFVEGTVDLTSRQLGSCDETANAVFEITNVFPPLMKKDNWRKLINALMAESTDTIMPEGAGEEEVIKEQISAYIHKETSSSMDDLLRKPVLLDGKIMINFLNLTAYIRNRWGKPPKHQVLGSVLKDTGWTEARAAVRGRRVRYYWKIFSEEDF